MRFNYEWKVKFKFLWLTIFFHDMISRSNEREFPAANIDGELASEISQSALSL
jgi:hypothetical protein